MKIAYCIPALYYPSGMERVLTLKANYFAEVFGYEIHIILTCLLYTSPSPRDA